MIPGSPKANIIRATAENPPAKIPAGSMPSLAKANPAREPPPRRKGPRRTTATAVPKLAERPCLVSRSQCRRLRHSAPRISRVVDTFGSAYLSFQRRAGRVGG